MCYQNPDHVVEKNLVRQDIFYSDQDNPMNETCDDITHDNQKYWHLEE